MLLFRFVHLLVGRKEGMEGERKEGKKGGRKTKKRRMEGRKCNSKSKGQFAGPLF